MFMHFFAIFCMTNISNKSIFSLTTRLQDSWLCYSHPLQLGQTLAAQMCKGLGTSRMCEEEGESANSMSSKALWWLVALEDKGRSAAHPSYSCV